MDGAEAVPRDHYQRCIVAYRTSCAPLSSAHETLEGGHRRIQADRTGGRGNCDLRPGSRRNPFAASYTVRALRYLGGSKIRERVVRPPTAFRFLALFCKPRRRPHFAVREQFAVFCSLPLSRVNGLASIFPMFNGSIDPMTPALFDQRGNRST